MAIDFRFDHYKMSSLTMELRAFMETVQSSTFEVSRQSYPARAAFARVRVERGIGRDDCWASSSKLDST
jgi:hypothetical protein